MLRGGAPRQPRNLPRLAGFARGGVGNPSLQARSHPRCLLDLRARRQHAGAQDDHRDPAIGLARHRPVAGRHRKTTNHDPSKRQPRRRRASSTPGGIGVVPTGRRSWQSRKDPAGEGVRLTGGRRRANAGTVTRAESCYAGEPHRRGIDVAPCPVSSSPGPFADRRRENP